MMEWLGNTGWDTRVNLALMILAAVLSVPWLIEAVEISQGRQRLKHAPWTMNWIRESFRKGPRERAGREDGKEEPGGNRKI